VTAQALFELAQDEDEKVSDVLTRALSLSSILRQKPVTAWLKSELGGFDAEAPLPDYRCKLSGTLVAWMPGQGWIEAPISNEVRAEVSEFELRDGIRELERSHIRNKRTGGQRLDLPENRLAELRQRTNLDTRLNMAVPNEAVGQVIEAARVVVRLWAEALVEAGLYKENNAFEAEDRQLALTVSERLSEFISMAAEEAPQRVAAARVQQGGFLSRLFGRA